MRLPGTLPGGRADCVFLFQGQACAHHWIDRPHQALGPNLTH
jgi:hypothetical protein